MNNTWFHDEIAGAAKLRADLSITHPPSTTFNTGFLGIYQIPILSWNILIYDLIIWIVSLSHVKSFGNLGIKNLPGRD